MNLSLSHTAQSYEPKGKAEQVTHTPPHFLFVCFRPVATRLLAGIEKSLQPDAGSELSKLLSEGCHLQVLGALRHLNQHLRDQVDNDVADKHGNVVAEGL